MSTGIINTIKQVALNVFKSSKPVNVLFGKVISTDPVKIQVSDLLTLPKECLVINGTVFDGDEVSLIRCQGGQKYVVLGTRTGYVEHTTYISGGAYVGGDGWQFPFRGSYTITSKFGVKRPTGIHKGVDIVGTTNKLIYPINNGTVLRVSKSNSGYGNLVVINHGGGYISYYAHLSEIFVKKDQQVSKNTIIGVEGSTGRSTGSHLHLEIRKGGDSSNNAIDPLKFLNVR